MRVHEWWEPTNENDGLTIDDELAEMAKMAADQQAADALIVLCEHCGSEGRLYTGQYDDERDNGECPVCEGTGSEVVETEPISEDDLNGGADRSCLECKGSGKQEYVVLSSDAPRREFRDCQTCRGIGRV